MGKRGSFRLNGLLCTLAAVQLSEGGYRPYVLDPSGPGGPPGPFGGPLGPSGPGFGGPPGPLPPPFYGGGPPFFGGPPGGPFGGFGGFRPFSPGFQGPPPPGFPYRQNFGQFPPLQHHQHQQPYIGQFPVVDPVKSGLGNSYSSGVPSFNYGPVSTGVASKYAQNQGVSYSGVQVVDPAKSTLFNSYLYQVNQQPNFNGLQNSVSEQQQYQHQPHAFAQNGASLPISYGETFQEEQVVQQPYQQAAAPSVAPEYAAPSAPSPSPPAPLAYTSNNNAAAASAPAPQDIQSSYSTYQAPLTSYVYQFSKTPYKFPANSANAPEGSKDVAVSAPSNEDMIVAAPPSEVLIPPRTDAPNTPPQPAEVVFEMTPATAEVSSTVETTSEAPTTLAPLLKERVKGRKKVQLGGGGKFVFGQRLSRGRSRSPFKNVELDFVDSRDSSTAAER